METSASCGLRRVSACFHACSRRQGRLGAPQATGDCVPRAPWAELEELEMAQPQQQVAAPRAAGQPAAAAQPVDRTGALTRGVPGYDAQAALLAPKSPRPEPQAAQAPRQAVPPGTPLPAGADTLSPLREAMLEQFRIMDGKGVGDAEFEEICGKS